MTLKFELCYKLPGGSLKRSYVKENADYSLNLVSDRERYRLSIIPKKKLILKSAVLRIKEDLSDWTGFFVNGYQSWTVTKEFAPGEQMHSLNRVPNPIRERFSFDSYGDYWFRQYKKDELHGFTFAYARDDDDNCELFGSLNEENAFLVITFQQNRNRILLEADCEGRAVEEEFALFDFVRYHGQTRETLTRYFSLFGECPARPLRGYTSWYLDYQNISQEKILSTLNSVDKENFDLFQIDDGYETFVGDWLEVDPVKFPEGLSGIVEKIHKKDLLAGIWLAPFVCEKNSRLYSEHPDWIYTGADGGEIRAGSNWSGFYPLDIRKRDVRNYIRTCLQFYADAGFDFFKLDFLYAAAMIKSSRFTRAEMMRFGMKLLRETLGERLILGCGVPLSSAFGLVDYCRIGPDISLEFDDAFYMRPMHNERISTRNTLLNTIYRSCMDGFVFRCDPDVYLLRDDKIRLTKKQREAVVILAHLCGAVYMTSDDPGQYDDEKRKLLDRARSYSGAEVRRIDRNGPYIIIQYENNNENGQLIYNSRTGVIL